MCYTKASVLHETLFKFNHNIVSYRITKVVWAHLHLLSPIMKESFIKLNELLHNSIKMDESHIFYFMFTNNKTITYIKQRFFCYKNK